jgi:hypothetical protein
MFVAPALLPPYHFLPEVLLGSLAGELKQEIEARTALVSIIGLGYVVASSRRKILPSQRYRLPLDFCRTQANWQYEPFKPLSTHVPTMKCCFYNS